MTKVHGSYLKPLDATTLRKIVGLGEDDIPIDWAIGAVHPDAQVRLSMVSLAAAEQSPDTVELLEWAVQDECDDVSIVAIRACSEMTPTSVLPVLLDLARTEAEGHGSDPRAEAARQALHRLGQRGIGCEPGAQVSDRSGDQTAVRLREEAQRADMRQFTVPGETADPYIDARPVSWAQVSRFIEDVGVSGRSWRPVGSPPSDYIAINRIARGQVDDGFGNEPATLLNWYDASALAAWRGCRLPRFQELLAGERTTGVGGWDTVQAEMTASRRLDNSPLQPFAGIDPYRDTADEWTLEATLFVHGADPRWSRGRHVLRSGAGVGFRCVHSEVLLL